MHRICPGFGDFYSRWDWSRRSRCGWPCAGQFTLTTVRGTKRATGGSGTRASRPSRRRSSPNWEWPTPRQYETWAWRWRSRGAKSNCSRRVWKTPTVRFTNSSHRKSFLPNNSTVLVKVVSTWFLFCQVIVFVCLKRTASFPWAIASHYLRWEINVAPTQLSLSNHNQSSFWVCVDRPHEEMLMNKNKPIKNTDWSLMNHWSNQLPSRYSQWLCVNCLGSGLKRVWTRKSLFFWHKFTTVYGSPQRYVSNWLCAFREHKRAQAHEDLPFPFYSHLTNEVFSSYVTKSTNHRRICHWTNPNALYWMERILVEGWVPSTIVCERMSSLSGKQHKYKLKTVFEWWWVKWLTCRSTAKWNVWTLHDNDW